MIAAACLAAKISSGRAGDGPRQARIDLLTAKTRTICSRTRTFAVRSRPSDEYVARRRP